MDRSMIYGSAMPQPWSQPYPHSAPPHPSHPRPLAAQYPPHDPHGAYTAPALYPTAVSQQMPHRYSQPPPLPNTLAPGLSRPRTRSSVGDNGGPFFETPPGPQFPSFPTPAPAQFAQASSYPPIPAHPPKPPALQHRSSGYPHPGPNPPRDELPIRPAPMSARRSSSSPAIGRIPVSDQPPPVPPLPPQLQSGYPQHAPQRISPNPPPPSIPIPSPYRSNTSPHHTSPYDTVVPPFYAPPAPHISPLPNIPTSSPHKSENDRKQALVDQEEEQLKRALALSEEESKISKEEEEELAKAIAESIRHASRFSMPVPSNGAGPSRLPLSASPLAPSTPLPVSESPASSNMPLPSPYQLSASRPVSKVSSPSMSSKPSIEDDAAFARRLTDEQGRAAGPSNPKPVPPPVPPHTVSEVTAFPAPAPAPAPASTPSSRRHSDMHRPQLTTVESEPPPLYNHVITSVQTPVPTKTSPISPNNSPSLGRSSSASAVMPSASRLSPIPGKDEKSNSGRSQSLDALPTSSHNTGLSPTAPTKLSSLQTVEESFDSPNSPPTPSPGSSSGPPALGPTANSFMDQQLLNGVSLGFNAPQISSIKTTLKGGVPNVISLPAGRFVPFHIQAPDWRHLLKMMARLSGSRVEASIEAMAGSKQDLKLRTVVQFVRVNTTSQDWRTVVYLTIDNPPPSNAPHKFTNGDVNTLPFSYSTSPLPTLLRDGSDAPMSKYYTIPATPNTPYPTLPISFPNMAMYLASAVEDSRRMAHDNSSGMRRLAKTLDMLYPAEVELGMEDDEPDKPAGGVMGVFRNVFGRGKKDQRRNDDNYADLVTPFVPEWG